MFGRLALLFVLVPLVELGLLIYLGTLMGVLPTVALVVGTGLLGATLAKWQGLQVLAKLRGDLAALRTPEVTLFEGVLVLLAGALLITPGVLTDVVGFSLLMPPVRRKVAERAGRWAAARVTVVRPGPSPAGGEPEIKDAEVHDVRTEENP